MRNRRYPYYSVPEPRDLRELVDFCAENYGKKTAFWYKTGDGDEIAEKSFEQLKSDADALGTYLYSIGKKEAHIAILGENSYEWIVSYFAIVNGGNVVVPIDKELQSDTICRLLDKADCTDVICSEGYAAKVAECGKNVISMSDVSGLVEKGRSLLNSGDDSYVKYDVDADAMCAIVFTSGTTSDPKGVVLTHFNLMRDAIVSSQNLLVPEGAMTILPLYHTFGFMAGVICQMLKGYPVYINHSLKRLMSDIKFAAPRHIAIVPMLIKVMYTKIWDGIEKAGKTRQVKRWIRISNFLLLFGIDFRRKWFSQVLDALGGNLEMIISGGSHIDEKYIKGFRDLGITVTNGYGITECSPIVSTMRNKHYNPDSVGAVQPGIEIRIVDGEIQLRGDTIFTQYYNDPEATEASFDGEWFRTGDLGELDSDGLLHITGRLKNLIVLSNGKNVAPEELEAKVIDFPGVREIVVYGRDDKIVAEIFPDEEVENAEVSVREGIQELNKQLPAFKQIQVVKFRDTEFPKTATQKIKRKYSKV